ncbi:MAG: DUF664 domain-containing protein [Acidimicrobiales bacterium]
MELGVADYLAFVDVTLDGYRRAIDRLDDTSANTTPPLPGANTGYALVTHATSATRWWLLHILAGQSTDRQRDDEFTSHGPVSDLHDAISRLHTDLHEAAPTLGTVSALANDPGWAPEGRAWTVGGVLMHAYEELAQHLGHLEITVDLVAPG